MHGVHIRKYLLLSRESCMKDTCKALVLPTMIVLLSVLSAIIIVGANR